MTEDALRRQARAIIRLKREGDTEVVATAKAREMDERSRLDRDGRYIRVPEIIERG